MRSIQTRVSKLCEPNVKCYPDHKARDSQWKQNITIFYAFLSTSIFFFAFYLASPSSNFRLFNAVMTISIFITFLILCRSHIWTFHLIQTLFISFAGFAVLELVEEFAYTYLGFVFALPAFQMMIHGDIKFIGFAGAMQILVMQLKFKTSLSRLVTESSPEEFSNRFVDVMAVHFGGALVLQLYFLGLLTKRTIELEKAQKTTEEVLERQRTFIFSFSHELRNPLNSLLGNLQLVLLGDNPPSVTREMVNTAKTCGEILLQAINNVLDTGKHEMGKLEVNPVPTRIHELFQRSWSIYQELFRQKKLKGSLRINKNVFAMVKIDAVKVSQIVSNLIGNSIKFTEKGAVNLAVEWIGKDSVTDECFEPEPYNDIDERSFEKDDNLSLLNFSCRDSFSNYLKLKDDKTDLFSPLEAKGVLKIIVQDTGCGMKPESLKKLFTKFSQVSEDIGRRQIGTGLGLFITKEICKAMNGDIRAYSKPSVGTTFVVCIPTVVIPSSTSSPPIRDSVSMTSLLKGKRIRALVADDSPFNVKLTCDYLLQLGGNVVSVAYNGEEAFFKYQENQAKGIQMDLVLLDIDMPKMNGKMACDMIRKFEQEHKIRPTKIVFISGNYEKEQMNEYLDKSKGPRADLFLKKPVSFDDFHAALFNLLVKE